MRYTPVGFRYRELGSVRTRVDCWSVGDRVGVHRGLYKGRYGVVDKVNKEDGTIRVRLDVDGEDWLVWNPGHLLPVWDPDDPER